MDFMGHFIVPVLMLRMRSSSLNLKSRADAAFKHGEENLNQKRRPRKSTAQCPSCGNAELKLGPAKEKQLVCQRFKGWGERLPKLSAVSFFRASIIACGFL